MKTAVGSGSYRSAVTVTPTTILWLLSPCMVVFKYQKQSADNNLQKLTKTGNEVIIEKWGDGNFDLVKR